MQNLKNSQNFLINKNLVRNLIVKSKLEKNCRICWKCHSD